MKSAKKLKQGHCSHGASRPNPAARLTFARVAILSSVPLLLIRAYQLTRFLRQPSCRFYPSCSQYTADSIERFGFVRGSLLGSLRILRCHPWHPGGVDEVPGEFWDGFSGFKLSLLSQAVKVRVTRVIPANWGHQVRGKG